MTSVLLDTHALIWYDTGDRRLGRQARALMDKALPEGALKVSAISFWEAAMLESRSRLALNMPLDLWRRELLEAGLEEIAVSGEIGIRSVRLPDFHADPADRIIVATAQAEAAVLLTADRRILNWTGALDRRSARS